VWIRFRARPLLVLQDLQYAAHGSTKRPLAGLEICEAAPMLIGGFHEIRRAEIENEVAVSSRKGN
jgi:hypothetical protein